MNWRSWWKRLRFWDRERVHIQVALPTGEELRHDITSALFHDLIVERRSNRRWALVKRSALVLLFLCGFASYGYFYAKFEGWSLIPSSPLLGVVRISGEISDKSIARADRVIPALKKAYESENVKAVAILINSPGGAPVEAERINNAISTLQKKHPKPTYAVIGSIGASAGYMVAMHADEIYAGRYSLVGSIGAVLASWDVHKALARFDVYQHVFASGELKAMLNPFTEPTSASSAKAQSLVTTMGERFHAELLSSRGEKLASEQAFGTGEVWGGDEARNLGLVDRIGTLETLEARLDTELGELTVHEFGPGAPSQMPFAADSFRAIVQEALVGAFKSLRGDISIR